MIQFIKNEFNKFIYQTHSIEKKHFVFYRYLYILSLVFIYGIWDCSTFSLIPDFFYNPPLLSIAVLFNGFPDKMFFELCRIFIYILIVMLLLGYKVRIISLLLFLTIIIENSFVYSLGKINHNIFLFIPLLLFSITDWSFEKNNGNKVTWPISLAVLMFSYAMFTAGLPKLMSGWLHLDTHAVKSFIYGFYYSDPLNASTPLSRWLINVNNNVLWEILDYAGTLFELAFIIFMFDHKLFKLLIFLAIGFHTINYLVLKIAFDANFIFYLLFIDWTKFDKIIDRSIMFFSKLHIKIISILCLAVIESFVVIYKKSSLLGYIVSSLSLNEYISQSVIILTVGWLYTVYWVISKYSLKKYKIGKTLMPK